MRDEEEFQPYEVEVKNNNVIAAYRKLKKMLENDEVREHSNKRTDRRLK